MSVTGSPFCEHKKLRTGCAICRAAGLPAADAGLKATPFRSRDDDEPAPRRARSKNAGGSATTPRSDAPAKLGGPAKPLMPTRARKKPVTAAEAERAQAWWVKK